MHFGPRAPFIAAGVLRPPISLAYELADAGEAIAALDERRVAGKVVLKCR